MLSLIRPAQWSSFGSLANVDNIDAVLRRELDEWFDMREVTPVVVGEFEDSALLKVFGQAGAGFFPVPAVIAEEVARQYGVQHIGTADGLVWLNTETNQLSVYRHESENLQSLSNPNVNSVLRDKNGTLWVGTHSGLNRMDPGTEVFKTYPLQFENPDPFSAPVPEQ